MKRYFLAWCVWFAIATVGAATPDWWYARGVITDVQANDRAVALRGQAKFIAQAASDELDETFAAAGGAGSAIHAIVDNFTDTDLNLPLDIWHLKQLGAVFYDRLAVLGVDVGAHIAAAGGTTYPWPSHPPVEADKGKYAALGQLKTVFAFDTGSRPAVVTVIADANTGDDNTGDGSEGQPYRSIFKLQEVVRGISSNQPAVRVRALLRGQHFLDDTNYNPSAEALVFTAADSGNRFPVTWMGTNGTEIVGGYEIPADAWEDSTRFPNTPRLKKFTLDHIPEQVPVHFWKDGGIVPYARFPAWNVDEFTDHRNFLSGRSVTKPEPTNRDAIEAVGREDPEAPDGIFWISNANAGEFGARSPGFEYLRYRSDLLDEVQPGDLFYWHHFFLQERSVVETIDAEANVIKFAFPTSRRQYLGGRWSRFYVEARTEASATSFLSPGQWWFGEEGGVPTLYYSARFREVDAQEDLLDSVKFVVPTRNVAVQLDGVKKLIFSNLTFRVSNWLHEDRDAVSPHVFEPSQDKPRPINYEINHATGGLRFKHNEALGLIDVQNSGKIRFADCVVREAAMYAISLSDTPPRASGPGGYNYEITIDGCEVERCSAGIRCGWIPCEFCKSENAEQDPPNQQITIKNSSIHDIGEVFLPGYALLLASGHDVKVHDNEIYHGHTTAILMGAPFDYRNAERFSIKRNHIHHFGREIGFEDNGLIGSLLSDIGAVHGVTPVPGSEVMHNHVHDITAQGASAHGIYLDQFSQDFRIAENVVRRISGAQLYLHLTYDNTVVSNVFHNYEFPSDTASHMVAIDTDVDLVPQYIGTVTNNYFFHDKRNIINILLADDESPQALTFERFFFDHNTYAHPSALLDLRIGNYTIVPGPASDPDAYFLQVPTWQANGQDANSSFLTPSEDTNIPYLTIEAFLAPAGPVPLELRRRIKENVPGFGALGL